MTDQLLTATDRDGTKEDASDPAAESPIASRVLTADEIIDLYEQYNSRMLGYATALTDPETAEDVCAEVWSDIHQGNIKFFDSGEESRLLGAVRLKAEEFKRNRMRRRNAELKAYSDRHNSDETDNPAKSIVRQEATKAALSNMSAELAAIIEKIFLEGKGIDVASRELGITPKKAEQRLERAENEFDLKFAAAMADE